MPVPCIGCRARAKRGLARYSISRRACSRRGRPPNCAATCCSLLPDPFAHSVTRPFMNIDLDRVRAELLSTGKLRAAINFGNPVLAQCGSQGEPQGVSVALARQAAERLGVELEFVTFEGAGKVVEAAPNKVWDIGFL